MIISSCCLCVVIIYFLLQALCNGTKCTGNALCDGDGCKCKAGYHGNGAVRCECKYYYLATAPYD